MCIAITLQNISLEGTVHSLKTTTTVDSNESIELTFRGCGIQVTLTDIVLLPLIAAFRTRKVYRTLLENTLHEDGTEPAKSNGTGPSRFSQTNTTRSMPLLPKPGTPPSITKPNRT